LPDARYEPTGSIRGGRTVAIILTQSEVRSLLSMDRCIDLMAQALEALASGKALNPLRAIVRLPRDGRLLGAMPGRIESPAAWGFKVLAVCPENHRTRYDSHQGVVVLFDPDHGVPRAIMDASEITAIRTAATSGLATRLLARPDAGELAILGTGVQARTHLEAMLAVREVRRVRVFSPDERSRAGFAARESERHGLPVEAVDSARACVEGASIVCTTTSSREPVVRGEWLAPGTHVNAVGACTPDTRELDTGAVARSRLFVDRRESALSEAGDFLLARSEGAIDDDHIVGEIADLLLGRLPGRRSDEEITLFESLGIAVEDLAAAHHVWQRARAEGVGTVVELGGIQDRGEGDND
jgi:ornithine cyclodeaminase